MGEEEPDLGRWAKGRNASRRAAAATWQLYRKVLADAHRRAKEFRTGPGSGPTLKWYDRAFACFLGAIFCLVVVIGFLFIPFPTLFDKILDLLKFAPLYLLIPPVVLGVLGGLVAYLADCRHGSRLEHFARGIQVIPVHIYLVVAWGGLILVPALLLSSILKWVT